MTLPEFHENWEIWRRLMPNTSYLSRLLNVARQVAKPLQAMQIKSIDP